MKTLLFCTSYSESENGWNDRYKSWYDYYVKSSIEHDKMLIFDDGSPLMPSFCPIETIYTFPTHLGKRTFMDYDGWYRSFGEAIKYAKRNGYDKIVHCEADAYLLSDRIIDFVNSIKTGWHCFWCPRHNMHESALQVICIDQIDSAINFTSKPYDFYRNQAIDCLFPYTEVHKSFIGDRYGENGTDSIPTGSDYSCQTSSNMLKKFKPMNLDQMLSITGKREESFRIMISFLKERDNPIIVETGCARVENNYEGDGMSTLIFDSFINDNNGSLFSVDINPAAVDFCKSKIKSPNTQVTCQDSVAFLNTFDQKIDLLYLDSYDLDPANPHPSSIHHIYELLAVSKCIKNDTMIVVDDNLSEEIGKGKYIENYFSRIDVPIIYSGYQQIWKTKK